MMNAIKGLMKIKLKYCVLYAVLALVTIALVINFTLFNHTGSSNSKYLSVGDTAPNYAFQLENGTYSSVNSYYGKPLLLWFVATWCSSCAQGNEVLASNLGFFEQHGVKIVELEQYDNLGSPGSSISEFISNYGENNTYVQGGVAGYNMTVAYNTPPTFQIDIYYLISPSGKILYAGEGLSGGITALENVITNYGL
jgi:thiol-disulfide isomerase/thioredoxin